MRLRLRKALVALLAANAAPAAAHGLGERYNLPLPLDLYLSGAALVVALSFGAVVAFARVGQGLPKGTPTTPLPLLSCPALPGNEVLTTMVRGFSAALFVLLVAAGFWGSPDPLKNPLPVSVWVIGWVGIAYVSGLLGNLWSLINPWDNLFRLGEWCAGRWDGLQPLIRYPTALGAWPAVGLFFAFAWMELIWPARDHPAALATAILGYTAITWSGMALFGRRTWLENGEAFAVAFGLLARFAILGRRASGEPGGVVLRPPAVGLLVRSPVRPSIAAFVLLMLSTVTFDGLLETPLWQALAGWGGDTAAVRLAGHVFGVRPYLVLATVALVAFPVMFAGVYLAVARAMAPAASGGSTTLTTSDVACLFVLTLVPIAIGYHLSHYLSYLLVAGQFIIPIASDPLGLGWDLFGTRLYLIDFSVIDARSVWYASLGLIVAGHVIAVVLAHSQAQRCFGDRRRAVRSQFPMLMLMIGYTTVSLWILAQPITVS